MSKFVGPTVGGHYDKYGKWKDRPELIKDHPSTQNTSVQRLPAPRDSMGGMNPNADRLRLMAPPKALPAKTVLPLLYNPHDGGGVHNPVNLDHLPNPGEQNNPIVL